MKCPNCNIESSGKFCTNCGTRMPDEVVQNVKPQPMYPLCSNCGEEVNGKFCIKCGTPLEIPQPPKAEEPAENFQQNPINEPVNNPYDRPYNDNNNNYQNNYPANNFGNQPQNENDKYAQAFDRYNNQFSSNNPNNYNRPNRSGQFNNYNNPNHQNNSNYPNQPNRPDNTNRSGNFNKPAAQKFTNDSAQNPKGKKSGLNKTGVIVICVIIVLIVLIVILPCILGFAACSFFKSASDVVNNASSGVFGKFNIDENEDVDDDGLGLFDIDESKYADLTNGDEFDEYTGFYNEETFCYYVPNDNRRSVTVVGFNQLDDDFVYTDKQMTIKIPEQINNLPVTQISSLGVYDLTEKEDQYIKIVIPGSVETIDMYAFSFCDAIDEIQLNEGVLYINENAFLGCLDLKKVHIPESTIELDDCGLGYTYNDDEEDLGFIGHELTIYGIKKSDAEKYAKEHEIKFVDASPSY